MKSIINFCKTRLQHSILSILLLIVSCAKAEKEIEIPKELIGTWKSSNIEIVVPEKDNLSDYKFHTGEGTITLSFTKNELVSGSIGEYTFSDGILTKGNIYKVVCQTAGILFNEDPLDSKEISLWLHNISEHTIEGELRLTQDGQKFPMTAFTLTKD